MTDLEIQAVRCLSQVRFPPASWDKRFARFIAAMDMISAKEAPQLWRLLKRYRRQIDHPMKAHLLRLAEDLAAPDLRKQATESRERARYEQAMHPLPSQHPTLNSPPADA